MNEPKTEEHSSDHQPVATRRAYVKPQLQDFIDRPVVFGSGDDGRGRRRPKSR